MQWLTDNLLEMFYTFIKIKSTDNTIRTLWRHNFPSFNDNTPERENTLNFPSQITHPFTGLSLISNPFSLFVFISVEAFCRTICKQWIFLLFLLWNSILQRFNHTLTKEGLKAPAYYEMGRDFLAQQSKNFQSLLLFYALVF